GGSDGGRIGLAAAEAGLPDAHRHIILTGPQMPAEDHQRVLEAARGNAAAQRIQVTRNAPHVPQLVRGASAVVSMGGYNSLAEIMATTTPALIVPRSGRRHEQPRRARALAAVEAVDGLESERLSPQAIGAWFAEAVHRRTARDAVELAGLMHSGEVAARAVGAHLLTSPLPPHRETRPVPH